MRTKQALVVAAVTAIVSGSALIACGSSTGTNATTKGPNSPASAPKSTTCSVQVLGSGLTYPGELVYAAGAVYVDSGGYMAPRTITRIALAGDPPATFLDGAFLIAADESNVYSSAADRSVNRTPVAGGPTTVVLPAGSDVIDPYAIDSTYLYAGWKNSSIVRVPLGGGNVETVYQGLDAAQIDAIAVDATNLYWTNSSGDVFWDARLMELPLAGGAATKLIGFRGPARKLALFDGAIYVADNGTTGGGNSDGTGMGNGSVMRVPVDGTASASLVDGAQVWVNGVAADSSGVYWGGGLLGFSSGPTADLVEDGGMLRVAANGRLEAIAPGIVAEDVVACDGGICWTDGVAGKVMRAVCDPNPSGSDSAPVAGENAAACGDFCGGVGNCARLDCPSVCAKLIGSSCRSEAIALAHCLTRNLDPLVCNASGCDAETHALNACRAPSSGACEQGPGGGGGQMSSDGSASWCESEITCKGAVMQALCDTESGTTNCTCLMNLTPIGTCSASAQPDLQGRPLGCGVGNGCCNDAFGSVAE